MRILVVEDEIHLAEALVQLLKSRTILLIVCMTVKTDLTMQ